MRPEASMQVPLPLVGLVGVVSSCQFVWACVDSASAKTAAEKVGAKIAWRTRAAAFRNEVLRPFMDDMVPSYRECRWLVGMARPVQAGLPDRTLEIMKPVTAPRIA